MRVHWRARVRVRVKMRARARLRGRLTARGRLGASLVRARGRLIEIEKVKGRLRE